MKHRNKIKTFEFQNSQSGFTLIELLVVSSIISLLASISLVGIQSARQSAMDLKYITTTRSLQKAVESFHGDKGYYPGQINPISGIIYYISGTPEWDSFISLLKPYLYGTITPLPAGKFIVYSVAPTPNGNELTFYPDDQSCRRSYAGSYSIIYTPTAANTVNQTMFLSGNPTLDYAPIYYKGSMIFELTGGKISTHRNVPNIGACPS